MYFILMTSRSRKIILLVRSDSEIYLLGSKVMAVLLTGVNFAYLWIKGLGLTPAQQACFKYFLSSKHFTAMLRWPRQVLKVKLKN